MKCKWTFRIYSVATKSIETLTMQIAIFLVDIEWCEASTCRIAHDLWPKAFPCAPGDTRIPQQVVRAINRSTPPRGNNENALTTNPRRVGDQLRDASPCP